VLLFFIQPANIQSAPEGYTFFVTFALQLMKPIACGWRHKGELYVTAETANIRTVHYICFVLFVDRLAVGGFISWLAGRHRYSLLCSWRSEYCVHILRDRVTGLVGIPITGLRQCLCELAGTGQFYDHSHAVPRKLFTPMSWNIHIILQNVPHTHTL